MWIVPYDSFLMKKLLKSEICGFVNSTRVHYLQWKSQQMRAFKKIKDEYDNAGAHTMKPNWYYIDQDLTTKNLRSLDYLKCAPQ